MVPLNLPGSQVCRGVGTIWRDDEDQVQKELIMNRYHKQDITGAVIPLTQLRRQRRLAGLANDSEVLRTRQDQTRPNTEPGRGFFFLGSLPHLARAWHGP